MTWYGSEQMILAVGEDVIEMQVGNHYITKGINSIYSDVAPMIIDDRTLIPLRALSEAIGYDVEWDGYLRLVTITTTRY